ncbi:MAG: autotransporter-associated beta strand repeat-containing protein [Luteolibacter sp.]|uniref:beta strand repeat-containing protein n=1 Tax=Luteolibacter sp. TaxID=1962973 RepID=UPI00326528EA
MKPRSLRNFPRTLVVCFAPLIACSSAHALVVAANEANNTNSYTLPSGANLLTLPASPGVVTHEGSDGNWSTVIDGTISDGGGGALASCTPNNGDVVTFPLNLTGHPGGRDVTSFDSYCSWGNSGRDNQDYTLQYSTVAAPTTFINITSASVHTGNVRSTHTRLTDTTGFLATGVHSLRVIFNNQENGYVGYREFIAQDTTPVAAVSNLKNGDNAWVLPAGPNLLTAPAGTANTHEGSDSNWGRLIDGSFGDHTQTSSAVTPNDGDSVVFPLDLTGHAGGRDIATFDSYAAWASDGRDDQHFLLEYDTVANPGVYVPITTIANTSEFLNGGNRATHSSVSSNTGFLATGAKSIKITFNGQENGYEGFREFIVRDTPYTINVVNESNNTGTWSLPSGTNLLNNGLTKNPGAPAGSNHGNGDNTGTSWGILTDGSTGSAGVQNTSVAPLNGTSVELPLDVSANTNGYNLTSFDSYCAWGDGGRDDQNFTIQYSKVGSESTFISLETVNNHTLSPTNATHTRITPTSGYLATNVAVVKFLFNNQENGYAGYREFIALGSAAPLVNDLTWTGSTNANWINPSSGNWKDTLSGVAAPFDYRALVHFDSTPATNRSITIPTALTSGGLTFSNDLAHPYTFSGDVLTVTNSIDLTGAGSAAFANSVTASGVSVSGTGHLTLSVDNTLTGSATVSNGSLTFGSDSAVGTAALSLSGGSAGFTSPQPILNSLSGTGGTVFLGNAGSNAHTDLFVGDATSSSYAGSIADASVSATGGLLKTGTGTLTLTGANTYSGVTTVSAGELKMGKRLSLYNGNTANWSASNILVAPDATLTLRVGGTGEFTSADVAALNTGGFDPGSTLSLDTTSGDAEISNNIGGSAAIEKQGINNLTLSGTNTFSSGITVDQGALFLANPAGASIPGDLTVGNITFDAFAIANLPNQFGPNSLIKFVTGPGAVNGKFQLRGSNQTVAGIESGTGNRIAIIQNDETSAPGYTFDPDPATLTINAATDHSFAGIIRDQNGGALSLVKNGAGTQELINAQVQGYGYTGDTTINQGTLKLNFNGGNTGFGSNVMVNSPATFAINAVGGDYNFDRTINGDGNVVVTGTNAVRFTNVGNSFTAGLTVGSPEVASYNGFLALVALNGVVQGAGNGPDQTCIAGAMTPTNVVTVQGGATLALDGIGPLGESSVVPAYAPSIVINNSGLRGSGLAFVANLTLNNAEVTVGDGIAIAGFDTSLCFVGTVTVGGDSNLASTINTPNAGPNANVSLGSAALPGTVFDVTDVTGTADVDLDVNAVLRNLNGLVSPLTKTGAGSMSLNQANTYTGDTTVSGGELIVSGNSIADSNKVILNGGKLGVSADETVGRLFYGGVQQIAGTYGSTTSSATYKNDSRFSGSAVLTVTNGPSLSYEDWALVIPNAADRDRTDDADGDGFSNLNEFLFGTSPIASNGTLSTVQDTGSTLIIRWCERLNSSSVYVLQESTTLSSWTASGVTPTTDANQTGRYSADYIRKQAVIPVDSAKKFVRVQGTE